MLCLLICQVENICTCSLLFHVSLWIVCIPCGNPVLGSVQHHMQGRAFGQGPGKRKPVLKSVEKCRIEVLKGWCLRVADAMFGWWCAQAFAQTLQQSRGFGSEFRFPDRPAGATTPAGEAAAAAAAPAFANGAADDDDDLYS